MVDLDTVRQKVQARSVELDSMDLADLEHAAVESEDLGFLSEVIALYQERNQVQDALRLLDVFDTLYYEEVDDEFEEDYYRPTDLARATIYYHHGEKEKALALWREIEQSEVEKEAIQARMYLLGEQEKHSEVLDEYARLVFIDTSAKPEDFCDTVLPALCATKQFAEAKEVCLKMLVESRFKVGTLRWLAYVEESAGNKKSAKEIYKTIVELDPYDHRTSAILANRHFRDFEWRSAWKVLSAMVDRQCEEDSS